jgi:hypothetical protein
MGKQGMLTSLFCQNLTKFPLTSSSYVLRKRTVHLPRHYLNSQFTRQWHHLKWILQSKTFPTDKQINGPWFIPGRGAATHVPDTSESRSTRLSTVYEGCKKPGVIVLSLLFKVGQSPEEGNLVTEVSQTVARRPFRKKRHCKNFIRHLTNEKCTQTCLC